MSVDIIHWISVLISNIYDSMYVMFSIECVYLPRGNDTKIDGNSLRAEGQCPWSYRLYSGSIGIGLDHHNVLEKMFCGCGIGLKSLLAIIENNCLVVDSVFN
jgi:hypothetical protein